MRYWTSLGIGKATVMGHSTGGMLAIRYALMYPAEVDRLVLVDPVGWKIGRPRACPGRAWMHWYRQELQTSAERIRQYEQKTYYAGTWRPDYDKWVQMLAGLNRGPGHQIVAWNSALIYDMIYTQPVVYELGGLHMPVLLVIGDKDTTAIGKNFAPAAVQAALGNYPALGKAAAAQIPHSTAGGISGSGSRPTDLGARCVPRGAARLPATPGTKRTLTPRGGIRIRRRARRVAAAGAPAGMLCK